MNTFGVAETGALSALPEPIDRRPSRPDLDYRSVPELGSPYPELERRGDPLPAGTYERMMDKARRGHLSGAADLYLSATGTVGMAILDRMHQDYVANPDLGTGPQDWISHLAESGVDWKACSAVVGALVVKNAARRMIRSFNRHDDVPTEIKRLESMTKQERFRERWAQRVGNLAVTAAVGASAYTTAEHQSLAHVFVTNTVALGSAAIGIFSAEYRAKKREEKRLAERMPKSPF